MKTTLDTPKKGLNVANIFNSDSTETLLILLEKNKLFPTHTSPKSTFLIFR